MISINVIFVRLLNNIYIYIYINCSGENWPSSAKVEGTQGSLIARPTNYYARVNMIYE